VTQQNHRRENRQAARQRGRDILADVRRNGWPGSRTRRELLDMARKLSQSGAEKVARVAHQGIGKARESGKAMARRVLAVQRDASLNRRLVERSAASVAFDPRPATHTPRPSGSPGTGIRWARSCRACCLSLRRRPRKRILR